MVNKLILGTVQFGLNYGISNSSGKPSEKEVFEILDAAIQHNIESLDTADAYGNAIETLGLYHQHRKYRFKILSKFKGVKEGELYEQAKISLKKLHIPDFEVYSYHSFTDYLNHPYLKDELKLLKSKGLIKKIGISIYTNAEFQMVIDDCDIDVIQLPYNLLDNHNLRGYLLEKAKNKNKEIHIRSVFLQGLFFLEENMIPERLKPLLPYIRNIRSKCENDSINLQSLALSYPIFNKHIDRVLIGVENKDQLLKNIESINDQKNVFNFINQNIKVTEIELLNPVNWKLTSS